MAATTQPIPRGVPINEQVTTHRRPRGRPPLVYRDKLVRQGDRARNYMEKVAFNATHPWHQEWGPKFLMELARLGTPRLTAIEGKDGAELKFADVTKLIYMDAIEADFVEVEVEREPEALAAP